IRCRPSVNKGLSVMNVTGGSGLLERERIEKLELQVKELHGRVRALEQLSDRRLCPPQRDKLDVRRAEPVWHAAPSPPRPVWGALSLSGVAERLGAPDRESMEDLLGGRVLAWVGGLAVLLGVVFLFAMAASRGWIGEGARVALGALASTGLIVAGIWLHEHRGRTDAALAALATGVSAMFVAIASAAGVLLRQRWDWLALAAFAVSVPQWGVYLFDDAGPVEAIVTLNAFGGLGIALAVGHEIRARAESIRPSSAFLLALNALIIAGAGFAMLARRHGRGRGVERVGDASAPRHGLDRDAALLDAGLGGHIALALIHTLAVDAPVADIADGGTLSAAGAAGIVVLSAACLVSGRLARPDRFAWRAALDALGLAALAYLTGLVVDGPTLAFAWIAEAGALMALAHRIRDRVAGWASLGFLALAGVHVLSVVVPLGSLHTGVADPVPSLAALGAFAAGAIAAGRLLPAWLVEGRAAHLRLALDNAGITACFYLTVLLLDGAPLTAAIAAEGVVLAPLSRRFRDPTTGAVAVVFLGAAALHGMVVSAPPVSLVTGLADPLDALVALGAVAAAAIAGASSLEPLHPRMRPALLGAAGVTALYLASGLVVTPFESGDAVDSALLSAHQQGQMVLSVFWALVGVGVLVTGLQRDLHALRVAGLALLGMTVAKVFLFDLATLSSMYRVVSFIGLGLLLP